MEFTVVGPDATVFAVWLEDHFGEQVAALRQVPPFPDFVRAQKSPLPVPIGQSGAIQFMGMTLEVVPHKDEISVTVLPGEHDLGIREEELWRAVKLHWPQSHLGGKASRPEGALHAVRSVVVKGELPEFGVQVQRFVDAHPEGWISRYGERLICQQTAPSGGRIWQVETQRNCGGKGYAYVWADELPGSYVKVDFADGRPLAQVVWGLEVDLQVIGDSFRDFADALLHEILQHTTMLEAWPATPSTEDVDGPAGMGSRFAEILVPGMDLTLIESLVVSLDACVTQQEERSDALRCWRIGSRLSNGSTYTLGYVRARPTIDGPLLAFHRGADWNTWDHRILVIEWAEKKLSESRLDEWASMMMDIIERGFRRDRLRYSFTSRPILPGMTSNQIASCPQRPDVATPHIVRVPPRGKPGPQWLKAYDEASDYLLASGRGDDKEFRAAVFRECMRKMGHGEGQGERDAFEHAMKRREERRRNPP